MLYAWMIAASGVIGFIFYIDYSSKRRRARDKAQRERVLPAMTNLVSMDGRYDIHINDGTRLLRVRFAGSADSNALGNLMGQDETLIVVRLLDERVAFLRPRSIRWIEESVK